MGVFSAGPTTTDDAGKPVRLLDSAGLCEWPSKGDARISELLVRARTAISRWDAPLLLVWFALWACFMAVYFGLATRFPIISHAGGAAVVVFGNIAALLVWRLRLRAGSKRFIGVVLEEGLCPCCGYNFAGLGFETAPPHSIVACPECGSSWFRWRIERTAAFAPDVPLALPTRLILKQRKRVPAWSVIDDSDAPVKLVHPRLARQIDAASDLPLRDRLLVARAMILHSRRWIRAAASTLLASGGIALIVMSAIAGLAYLPLGLIGFIICGVLAIGAWFGNFAYSPACVRDEMLSRSLCPGCGADLRGLQPRGHRGVVRCERCGAQWDAVRAKANEPASG